MLHYIGAFIYFQGLPSDKVYYIYWYLPNQSTEGLLTSPLPLLEAGQDVFRPQKPFRSAIQMNTNYNQISNTNSLQKIAPIS